MKISHRKCLLLAMLLSSQPVVAHAEDKLKQDPPPRPAIELQKGLVSEWRANLDTKDSVGGNNGEAHGALTFNNIAAGTGFLCNGDDAGVNIKDAENLKLTKSLTISAWVDIYGYPKPDRLWGQIVMRADDRPGLDPYFLAVSPDQKLTFTIESETASNTLVYPVPLGQVFLATATLDDETGTMRLYANGVILGESHTDVRPLKELDSNSNPGVGIGYSQGYPKSQFHQAFNGIIGDVRIYNRALTQAEVQALYLAGTAHEQKPLDRSKSGDADGKPKEGKYDKAASP